MARSSWLRTNVKEVELVRDWFVDCLSSISIAAPEWFCGDRRAVKSGK
jgi:hypothetical protein